MDSERFVLFNGKILALVTSDLKGNRCGHCYSIFGTDPNGDLCFLFKCMDNYYYLEYSLLINSYIRTHD